MQKEEKIVVFDEMEKGTKKKKDVFSGDWKYSCVCVACGVRYKLWFPHSVGVRVDMDSEKRYNHNAAPFEEQQVI